MTAKGAPRTAAVIAYEKQYVANNPKIGLLKNARKRAKANGFECTITAEDIQIPEFCPYLGLPIERSSVTCSSGSPTIDRVSLDKGYVPGNIEVVSMLANRMKNNANPEQLLQFAREVIKRHEVRERSGRQQTEQEA